MAEWVTSPSAFVGYEVEKGRREAALFWLGFAGRGDVDGRIKSGHDGGELKTKEDNLAEQLTMMFSITPSALLWLGSKKVLVRFTSTN